MICTRFFQPPYFFFYDGKKLSTLGEKLTIKFRFERWPKSSEASYRRVLESRRVGAIAHPTIEEIDVFNIWKDEECAVNELKESKKKHHMPENIGN